jgi:hypothetical protein
MKLFLAKDTGGMFLFDSKPIWDKKTNEFYPKTAYTNYELTSMFDNNLLKIGECIEIEIKL